MKSKDGFTKKDIIVVFGCIIFLLMNIGAISGSGRRRAKAVVCLSNLRKWGIVFSMYCADHEGSFNPGNTGRGGGVAGFFWMDPLFPYHKDRKLQTCPMAVKTYMYEGGQQPFVSWGGSEDWYPPLSTEDDRGSYGQNCYMLNPPADRPHLYGFPTRNNWRTANIKGADNVPIFGDCMWIGTWPKDTDDPPEFNGDFYSSGDYINLCCFDRHNGTCSSADGGLYLTFADFSARKVGVKEVFTLKWHRAFDTEGPWTAAGGVQPEDWPDWMSNFKDY